MFYLSLTRRAARSLYWIEVGFRFLYPAYPPCSCASAATNHISVLESENKALQDRIAGLEEEIRRLQTINDKLSGGSLETPSPGMYDRPLSPPPEVTTLHSHSSLAGATGPPDPQQEDTPSPSDGSF
jgi:hypothetical protein